MVDSNALLDVLLRDGTWADWSGEQLARAAQEGVLVINPIVYAEVSIGFERIEELESALPELYFRREAVSWEAAFLAGTCFVSYRRKGGTKCSPLPDFFIGAHALIRRLPLLTRDAARYRTQFPALDLICPARHR